MAEQKFKVGDRVRLIEGGESEGWTDAQSRGVVIDLRDDGDAWDVVYKDDAEGEFRRATANEIELDPDAAPVEEPAASIVDEIAAIGAKVPAEEWAKVPADLSERIGRSYHVDDQIELRRRERLELVGRIASGSLTSSGWDDDLVREVVSYADAILAHLDATATIDKGKADQK